MPRTLEQRYVALAQANRVRFGRAAIRAAVGAGTMTVADAIAHPDVQTEKVHKVLRWQQGVGQAKVRKWLMMVPCSEAITVGQLTDRQRQVIRSLTEGRCAWCDTELRRPALLCGFCRKEAV